MNDMVAIDKKKSISTRRLSKDDLLELLKNDRDPESLIGVRESEQIDFKGEPYHFEAKGKDNKFEIAKDVAAIANSKQGGGIICIGVTEEQNDGISYAKSVNGCGDVIIKELQYRKLIYNSIYPYLDDDFIEFRTFSMKKHRIFCIIIKETPREKFPLLAIKKDGNQIEYFIAPYRQGSRTVTDLEKGRIHEYIRDGLEKASGALKQKDSERIEKKIDLLIRKTVVENSSSRPKNILSRNISKSSKSGIEDESLIQYAKDTVELSKGLFYMHAVPEKLVKISKIYDRTKNKIYELMLNPPKLRQSGWDLGIAVGYGEVPTFSDNKWESRNGDKKLLIVNENAEIFAAGAINGFLDYGLKGIWSSEKIDGELINNFALVEFIDRFIAFWDVLVKQITVMSNYDLELGFILPDQFKLNLYRPFHLGVYFRDSVPLKSKSHVLKTELKQNKREVKYIAGEIIAELYARCFGEIEPPLAYLDQDEKGWFVQEERFVSK